jgi:beta-lactamase regulating signal transducer with metallopeptidase domain
MSAIPLLSSQPWVERLGWTLVHFLWQGVLIAALYAATRSWIANSSRPNTRYILACVALAAMMAAPLVTWSLMRPSDAVPVSASLISRVPVTASTVTATPPVFLLETDTQHAQFLPWVVAIWLAGAIALWMRLIGGWIVAARIGSRLVRPAPPEWQQTLNRLKARVGVSRPVRLLISALVQAPAVVGWLRPVVLVPIGSLAGLPSEQIEALLSHELAHIRRHDYLVNILQSVAEALLFYHPAVWWVSGHIRTERELCCDDVAVSVTGDAFTYALALAEIESSRPAHLHAAMAADGGSLSDRIARLLGQSRPASRTLPGPGGLVGAILLAVTACVMFGQSADTPRFDVASIKLDTSAAPRHIVRPLPGGLHTENAFVRMLMQNAYALQSFQIVGGPGWIDSAGYNIEAKADAKASQRQVFLMLQSPSRRQVQAEGSPRNERTSGVCADCGEERLQAANAEGRGLLEHYPGRVDFLCRGQTATTRGGPGALGAVRQRPGDVAPLGRQDAGRKGTYAGVHPDAVPGARQRRDRQDRVHGALRRPSGFPPG